MSAEERQGTSDSIRPDLHACGRGWTHGMGDNLVHWDLNPNPQRLEQRTWRLTAASAANKPVELPVLFPMLRRSALFTLEQRILDRYDLATGTSSRQRPYIPENANLSVNLSGSVPTMDLSCLMMRSGTEPIFTPKTTGGWPGHNFGNQNSYGCTPCSIWFSSAIREFILGRGQVRSLRGVVWTLGGGRFRIALVDLETLLLRFREAYHLKFHTVEKPFLYESLGTKQLEGIRLRTSSPPLANCSEACHGRSRAQCP